MLIFGFSWECLRKYEYSEQNDQTEVLLVPKSRCIVSSVFGLCVYHTYISTHVLHMWDIPLSYMCETCRQLFYTHITGV